MSVSISRYLAERLVSESLVTYTRRNLYFFDSDPSSLTEGYQL